MRKDLSLAIFLALFFSPMAANAVPTQTIAQFPLVLLNAARPQVLIAVQNSLSMSGLTSGAIMSGSGTMTGALASFNNSTSPVNYVIPTGFTPPLQAANSAGLAPYTVTVNGTQYDNGPSRLNMAKAAIKSLLQTYLPIADFSLETYSATATGPNLANVYYMSPQGGNFVFTNTQTSGNRYVANPCYNYTASGTSSAMVSGCTAFAAQFSPSTVVNSSQYIQIGYSSDDSNIGNILALNSSPGAYFIQLSNTPNPTNPYTFYTLANYNTNNFKVGYTTLAAASGYSTTLSISVTNGGFLPYSPQLLLFPRGYKYLATPSATTGRILVAMTTLAPSPTPTELTDAYNLFSPYLGPTSNSSSTTEIKAGAIQSPLAGMMAQALTTMKGLATSSCTGNQYVILFTDGMPTLDLSNKQWPPLGSLSATNFNVTATYNADGSLKTTNNQALTDLITKLKALASNTPKPINTYVIGLGAGVNPSVNPQAAQALTAMAIAGNTGNYYSAASTTEVVNALGSIMAAIQGGSFSTSATAVSSSNLTTSTNSYQASFTTGSWTGDVIALALDATTGLPSTGIPIWSAQTLLDTAVASGGWANRLIASWNPTPTSNSALGSPIVFSWANLTSTQQSSLQPSDTLGSSRVNYLKGDSSLEVKNGGTFRNRAHVLGDIVNSQPLYVGPPNSPYFSNSTYPAFVLAQASRTPMIYVGANDGMLHAFRADTGAEVFAYLPNGVFANLISLTAPIYSQSHLYYVDGSPQSGDVQFADGTWHTLLTGGENAGGSSVYALDITTLVGLNSSNVASKVLWEFTDGDMGLSYSQPVIAPINSTATTYQAFAVFFGNGYNSPTNKAVLYALNPQTGATIKKIDLCAAVASACDTTKVNGLSSVAVGTSDGIQGNAITTIYAGDLQGNLWAVDVGNPNPSNWTTRLLFQARDSSGAIQPITTPPVVTLNPLYPRLQGFFILFATGQFLTAADISSTQTQTIYGVWDKPGNNLTYTRSNLQMQNLTLVSKATSSLPQDIVLASGNSVSWASQVGWYTDLPVGGMKVIGTPRLFNKTFLATVVAPAASSCLGNVSTTLLELNYQNGGAFSYPILDINGSGTITSADAYGGGYAVGMVIAPNSYAAGPTLLQVNSANTLKKIFTGQNISQSVITNINSVPSMISWWQLQ